MLRVTDDILELRQWAEERGGRPCRHADGRIDFAFGGDGPALCIGWDEFEVLFVTSRDVCAYDDAPGGTKCFIGSLDEVRACVQRIDPRARGAAGPTV